MISHPDQKQSDEAEGSDDDLNVALDTLSAGDGTPPAVGDEVDVQVKGKVSRIEGNSAYVTPTTCNGEPPPDMGDDGDADDALQKNAAQADQESGYSS